MTKRTDTPDLRSHFHLTAVPFTREIGVRDLWPSAIYQQPLKDLTHTLRQRMSAVLLAPSGTGKTGVLRALEDQLPAARYRCHYVKVTSLSKRDLCREIATVTGIEPVGTYPALVRKLQTGFSSDVSQGGIQPVLILDEAQDMRPEVLQILRILTNFEMDSRLVLSLVLAGDGRLERLLQRQDIEPVRRRMAHLATLRLLSREETRSYMEHRIRVAGGKELPFDHDAVEAVFEISRGNLRAIDHVARKAMYYACQQGISTIDSGLVTEARQSLLL